MQLYDLWPDVFVVQFLKFNLFGEGEDADRKIHDGRGVDVRGIGRFLIDEFLKRER